MERQASKEIEVSVYCITYNQSAYIKRCLDSLISQQTSFKYEIVVHDDASTDGTTDILLDYAQEYPETIIPVIEEENIYSKGKSIREVVSPYIHGKYVAICEGDDWWTDPHKLQIQLNYMEDHPECTLCVHCVGEYDEAGEFLRGEIAPAPCDRDFSVEDVIMGDGNMFGTNSMFFRSKHFLLPRCYTDWGVGDYPTCIYLATMGSVHYHAERMSAYRASAAGSWSKSMENDAYRIKHLYRVMAGLNRFDEETGHSHKLAVQCMANQYAIEIAVLEGDLRKLLVGQLSKPFREMPFSLRLKKIIKAMFPELRKALRNL